MTLSKLEALEIQTRDLEQWKTLLKPEIHAELVKRVTHYNNKITQPRDIIRGCGVTEIILNWHNPNWNRQLVFTSLA